MNIGLIVAFIIIILTGVIYGRIAGYVGSVLRFSYILELLLKLIRKIKEKLNV